MRDYRRRLLPKLEVECAPALVASSRAKFQVINVPFIVFVSIIPVVIIDTSITVIWESFSLSLNVVSACLLQNQMERCKRKKVARGEIENPNVQICSHNTTTAAYSEVRDQEDESLVI